MERLLRHVRQDWARDSAIDLVTCYAGAPAGFDPQNTVYRVADYGSAQGRRDLLRQLRARRYSIAGILCSGEPVMSKWKWLIVLRLPVKVFVVNENGDYFWINRAQVRNVWGFCLARLGLSGEGSLRTVGRLLIFPFALAFLLLYAFAAHCGRIVRLALHSDKL